MRRYLQSYVGTNLLFLAGGACTVLLAVRFTDATFWPIVQDHPGAIGTEDWYMNFRRSNTTQALDREVMYHGVGHSMEHARDADIIILGHSMGLFAFDWRLLQEFSKEHGVKIFNLSSGGDASGEFLLQVALKNGLRPKIWLINADDHEKDFFFGLCLRGRQRRGGRRHVLRIDPSPSQHHRKNLKWRFELLLRKVLPRFVAALIYPARTDRKLPLGPARELAKRRLARLQGREPGDNKRSGARLPCSSGSHCDCQEVREALGFGRGRIDAHSAREFVQNQSE